jgi:hypothetical protein
MGFATQAGPQTRIHQGHADGSGVEDLLRLLHALRVGDVELWVLQRRPDRRRAYQGHADGSGARAGERQTRAAGRTHRTPAHALLGGQRGRQRAQLGAQAPQQRKLGLARQLVQRRLCAAGARRAMRLGRKVEQIMGGFLVLCCSQGMV